MRFRISLIILLFLTLTASAIAQSPFQRMDVFDLQWVDNPQISPDGTTIIYQKRGFDIMTDRRTSALWMITTDGRSHRKLSSFEGNESQAVWSPSGDRLAYVRGDDTHGSELYIYWMESGVSARISQLESSPASVIWSPDGKHLAFTMKVSGKNPVLVSPPKKPKGAKWADAPRVTDRFKYEQDGAGYISPGFRHVFMISADGGSVTQLTEGDYDYSNPVFSADGTTLYLSSNRHAERERERRNSEIYALDIQSGAITALTDRFGPDYGAAISPDGNTIAYLGYEDKIQTYQVNHIWLMDADGSNKRELKTGLDRNPAALQWKSDGKGLYFMYDDHGKTMLAEVSLDGKVKVLAENTGGASIGRPYGGASYSASGNGMLAFNKADPSHPAELAMVDRKGNMTMLTDLNAALLKNRTLGAVEEITYTSTVDGIDIQGWLVYPPEYDADRTYPLVVEIHGGPISNYGPRFSPEMQLYAAAGYVVFYPNMRGSTSYGEEFGNLLYHDYPGDDYQDIMDGVDVLISKGITSEDSLYVTGGSAGGIMSAWMIGKNNRFEAAAVIKPVMNWISKTLTADNYYGYAEYRYPGQPWEEFETYWKYSPISLVGNVETPTLVMVGTEDMRTPLSEAKQLYNALQIRDIETMLVEIPGASHFIANRPSQLIAKIDHIIAWFERYR